MNWIKKLLPHNVKHLPDTVKDCELRDVMLDDECQNP